MKITKYGMGFHERIPVLVKESVSEEITGERILTPEDAVAIMKTVYRLHKKTEEYVYLLALSTSGTLLGVFEIAHGSVNSSIVSTRSIFQRALVIGAARIIVVHNHPSGDCTPSTQDKEITKRIKEAGDLMEIPLVDHIIIGDHFFSFCEQDIL